jgi:amino acid permease
MSRISGGHSDPERGDGDHPRNNRPNSQSSSLVSPDQSPVDRDQPAGENRARPRKLFKGRHIQMIAFGNVFILLTCG